MKIAFVTDTGTGYTPNDLSMKGVYSVPLQIINGDKSLLELVEISISEVYELIGTGVTLKTSLASMELTEKLFSQLKEDGYTHIFAVPICSGLSGTINMMRLVASDKGLEFDYYDCHVTAYVQKYLIELSKQLSEEGKSFEDIKEVLDQVLQTTNTLLVPDDLKHLQRGGRLTPIAATLGGLLKIKPILQINAQTQGRIDVLSKVRTMKKALLSVVEQVKQDINSDGFGYDIHIAHVVNISLAKEFEKILKESFPQANISISDLVSVVGIHTGVGCIAIQYYKKIGNS